MGAEEQYRHIKPNELRSPFRGKSPSHPVDPMPKPTKLDLEPERDLPELGKRIKTVSDQTPRVDGNWDAEADKPGEPDCWNFYDHLK